MGRAIPDRQSDYLLNRRPELTWYTMGRRSNNNGLRIIIRIRSITGSKHELHQHFLIRRPSRPIRSTLDHRPISLTNKLNFNRWTSHCPRYRTFYRFYLSISVWRFLSRIISVEPSSDESNLKLCSIYVPKNFYWSETISFLSEIAHHVTITVSHLLIRISERDEQWLVYSV